MNIARFGCVDGEFIAWRVSVRLATEATNAQKVQRVLLDELLEHPVLRLQMTSEGIERRCIDLIVEATRGYYRAAEADLAPPLPD